MAEDDVTIRLTRDQALVLSDWLSRMIGSAEFDRLADQDRAVWSPLYDMDCVLEASLEEVLAPNYSTRLDAARQRLLDTLGQEDQPTGQRSSH
jgi:hypothetical protein